MNDGMSEPRLDFAPFVSREHGDVFAEIIFERLQDSEIIWEAFRATKLIGSPGADHEAAVERYDRLAEEIRKLAFALTKRHLSEAFAIVGTIVLDRERHR